uniref:NADH-ubiquinone oxidoreductase chain 4 n=1 Tax=Flammulina velutipes TaxID=38945 RepID=A0A0A0MZ97_FLAVE|nr:NADH dehydrogenase subunit 4 [Flammulina velutipes]
MLTLLILIPVIGAILILPINTNISKYFSNNSVTNLQTLAQLETKETDENLNNFLKLKKKKELLMRQIALTTSLINFFISLFLLYLFDSNNSHYQFISEFNQLNFCHFNFGIDGISIFFVLLTTFVTPIAILSNYYNITNNFKVILISLLILESLQICAFVSLDLLLFYVFFESILPILFIVIVIFGHGNDRFRSAFLFFLYTLTGSLPMLLSILMINSFIGSTDFSLIALYDISFNYQIILWIGFFIALAVKTPLYPMIIWLPKAHADSALSGSIILAATVLKLATYGYLRVLINMLPDATNFFNPFVLTIAVISIVYASFSTIVQQDTKRLIAYSSIAHMGVVVLGLFSNTIQGIQGGILMGIAHGFVSPALFICVGGVIFDRLHTRTILNIRGLVTYMPVFTILFFLFTLANTGIPLTLNFLGEQLSLIGIFERNPIIAVIGASGIVLSAIYSMFLYNRISYGSYSPLLNPLKDISRREFMLLFSLLIPTILLGLFPNILLECLNLSVSKLLYV